MGKLDGKTALVTGGGQGVGRGISLALAREGAAISIAELDPDTGSATARELEKIGTRAFATVCDVSVRQQVDEAVARTLRELGGVDILVNNATWTEPDGVNKPLLEHTEADFDRHFAVAVKGSFHFMQACFPHLADRGGKIINLASEAGSERVAGHAAYAAAKEAVRALTGVAAREWGRLGIQVNAICPFADTPSTKALFDAQPEFREQLLSTSPIGRLGDAEIDVGRAVVFLASTDSDFITGQTVWVDGGRTIHS